MKLTNWQSFYIVTTKLQAKKVDKYVNLGIKIFPEDLNASTVASSFNALKQAFNIAH